MRERTKQLHEQIRKAVRERRQNDHRLARLLAEFDADRGWAEMRYPSLQAYARSEHDMNAKEVREKRRLGRRLLELPQLDAVLARGELDWTKARTVLPVITPENEAAWVERVLQSTVRDLEAQVRVAVRGEPPPDPREARLPERGRLVIDVETQDKQSIHDTIALVRAQSRDLDLTDGEILAMICAVYAETLEGKDRPTRAVHQVIVEWCPGCNDAHGIDCELSDTLISEAACNPEVIDMRPGPNQGGLSRKIPPKVQRQVFHRARRRCEVPGCCNRLWLHIHHLYLWSKGGDHSLENLMCLCSAHHREVHEGLLAIELLEDGSLRFERADGRVLIKAPHVGCPTPSGTATSPGRRAPAPAPPRPP